jgi:hypothetical protein
VTAHSAKKEMVAHGARRKETITAATNALTEREKGKLAQRDVGRAQTKGEQSNKSHKGANAR